ncbi:ester cyclase [Shewanella surugensis]|uniref:Ester cyclase n=1 Tax=Shewanella surugensis TaxID=212020 RepID=A0ABT0LE21_9GAMM|nr:ester cyclase [Shewanella surugensis]MCL1125577.1 ester cyclase [Shewanella surugensis]
MSDKETLSPLQQQYVDIFEEHMAAEFEQKSIHDTMATMDNNPYVINIPTLRGGDNYHDVREFYEKEFIGHFPDDMKIEVISKSFNTDLLVTELVMSLSHDQEIPWLLPNVAPTNKKIAFFTIVIVIVNFKDGKVASERIYWDQASVLAQVGLIDEEKLPVNGQGCVHKLLELVKSRA